MADPTTLDAIDAAAAQYGLSPAVLKGIASIESSFNPESNRDRSTQYKGLFQIGRDEWRQYGGGGDIYNAADNANAAARMLADHSQWFKDQYGRDPTPGDLYMMHQQGRGFFTRGALTNVAGNPYPGMRGPQTPETFAQGWGAALARHMAPFGGAEASAPGPATPAASPAVALAQATPVAAPYFAGAAQAPAAAVAPAASAGAPEGASQGMAQLGQGLLAPQLGAAPKVQLPPAFRPRIPQLRSLATIAPSIYFPRG